jgi:hypothetical protein
LPGEKTASEGLFFAVEGGGCSLLLSHKNRPNNRMATSNVPMPSQKRNDVKRTLFFVRYKVINVKSQN